MYVQKGKCCNNCFNFVHCSLCIKHPNLFGGSEKLDVSWDKGLYDSNILVAYRRPRPEWLSQQCFVIQVVFLYQQFAFGLDCWKVL